VNVDTGAFMALTGQVADLAARVAGLEVDAFEIRTLEEMRLRHAGFPHAAPAAPAPRPRHLRAVDGSQP
jgi:hypothetical protein